VSVTVRARPLEPSRARLLQRLRVPLGFVFGALFLIFAAPSEPRFSVGMAVALGGLLLRVWAAGHLRKHTALAQSGPYRWTRNPLYLGSFFLGLGFSLAAGVWWFMPLFLALFGALYIPVMRREEEELRQAYGGEYLRYMAGVPFFLPRRPRPGGPTCEGFAWRRVLLNREYNAVIGYMLLGAYLLWRGQVS
jgi:protein-S-isoprenylcysteine O-methyltransferase Ste14